MADTKAGSWLGTRAVDYEGKANYIDRMATAGNPTCVTSDALNKDDLEKLWDDVDTWSEKSESRRSPENVARLALAYANWRNGWYGTAGRVVMRCIGLSGCKMAAARRYSAVADCEYAEAIDAGLK